MGECLTDCGQRSRVHPQLWRRDSGRVRAKCAYSKSYTDGEHYSGTNSHSDADSERYANSDSERYADCHTNIYTKASSNSQTAPDSTPSLTRCRIEHTLSGHQKFSRRKFLVVCDPD